MFFFFDRLGNYSQQNFFGLLGILTNQYSGMTFLVLNAVHLNHFESKRSDGSFHGVYPPVN